MEPDLKVFEESIEQDGDAFYKDIAISSLKLSNLQTLNIPGSEKYRLDDDHIFTLTTGIADANIQLKTLSLCYHRISDIGFENICTDIVRKVKLLHLDLEGNDILGANLFALQLQSSDCPLLSLNLSCNPLALTTGMTIANSLRSNQNLISIGANNCGFNLNVIIALAATLKQNSTLEILKIDRPLLNTITRQEEGTDHLSRLLDGSHSRK
jgi:hypothetical protein